jgi:hypothetical protein
MTPKAILDSIGAMPQAAPATREPSRNLRSVSAVPASVRIAGPSERFVKLTRDPDLPRPARFEPTVKGEGDVIL